MAGIRLIDLTKLFGATTAVHHMNLEIKDREFIVLVGPSGCGKTTTLRMIAGLEDATDGMIYIGDRLVNDVPPKSRDIAMVFQNYALYPHMSVLKNITFALRLRKMPEDEIHKRVRDAAEMLGIQNLLSRKPKELSGGQCQRVAMGRAIVRNPAVFLFDEPLSNLDAKLRVQMRGELSRLHDRLKTTVVYVTHDQIEAMTLADRIVVMDRGRVRQIGRPLEVYDHPEDLFVAGFIGSPGMNFLDARVVDSNDRLLVVGESFRLLIPQNLEKGLRKAIERDVVLGLRPEHLHDLEQKSPFPGGEKIRVIVEAVEPIGSEVILVTSCGSSRFTARVKPGTRARPGETMELLLDMNQMHLFDGKTAKSI